MSPDTLQAVDTAVRVHAARALRQAGHERAAFRLENLAPITDSAGAWQAHWECEEAQEAFEEKGDISPEEWVVFSASRAAKCAGRGSKGEAHALRWARRAAGEDAS